MSVPTRFDTRVVVSIREYGIAAQWEYPGYISVRIDAERVVWFGGISGDYDTGTVHTAAGRSYPADTGLSGVDVVNSDAVAAAWANYVEEEREQGAVMKLVQAIGDGKLDRHLIRLQRQIQIRLGEVL